MSNIIDVLAVIPLRLKSTRVPKKVLAKIGDRTLAERTVASVLEAFKAEADSTHVIAAVDSAETEKVLKARFPGLDVVVTDPALPSGTDRVAQAASDFAKRSQMAPGVLKGIINIQGDMPFVGGEGLRDIAKYFRESNAEQLEKIGIATLAQEWPADQKLTDAGAVKVLTDKSGVAIYFSRFAIPYTRLKAPRKGTPLCWLHLGVYGFSPAALVRFCSQTPTELEQSESLEQLRALWLGLPILVLPTEPRGKESYRGIDTPKDLLWARKQIANKKPAKKAKKIKARKK